MARQTGHAGVNRTGILASPVSTGAMLDNDGTPIRGAPGDARALLQAREACIADAGAIGSLPAPGPHGTADDGLRVLLDNLGERLSFERTSTRLYDALLAKCAVMPDGPPAMTRERIADIRRDEARHFLLLKEAIDTLGGDPTSQTPSADTAGIEAIGIVQVLHDPRTSLAQSLHALLTAELADGAGWETLVALACGAGRDDLVAGFAQALDDERRHLALIQGWYQEAIGLAPASAMLPPGGSAGLPPDATTAPTATPDVTTPPAGADI